MKRKFILLGIVAVANIGLVLWAAAPLFISYADLAPYGGDCVNRKEQAALIHFGEEVALYNVKRSIVPILLLAFANFSALSYLVVRAKP